MIRAVSYGIAAALILGGCGYDGSIRYPCQEFQNWETAACQKGGACEADSTCTRDLVDQ